MGSVFSRMKGIWEANVEDGGGGDFWEWDWLMGLWVLLGGFGRFDGMGGGGGG